MRGEQVLLLKPTTYMNLSGRAVREVLLFHKLGLEDLLVVVDDMALPVGRLRLRPRGSAGGHNGLASVIQELGGEGFARLRIGIERVSGQNAVQHVLSKFEPEDEELINQTILRAADAVECWLTEGSEAAMNVYNRPEESSGR